MSDEQEMAAGPPPAPPASASRVPVTGRTTSFSTTRPVAIAMVFLAAVVFGYFSYGRLPVKLMPEMAYPTLTVRTEYDGAAPEEVENDISRPIEEALGVIGGLRRLSSISRADLSDVVLEFSWDTPMSEAIQDTLEKLDLVLLPDAAERPLILRFDPSLDPVLELSLSAEGEKFQGEVGLRRLRRIADLQVKRALEPIRGVAAVRVRGGLEEEIHVLLNEEALRRSGLSIQRVIERLGQENINVAGGTIKEGRTEFMVRTLNEYQNLEQIADTTVARFEGRDVKIRDLGRVVPGHKEREILTRTDGQESVQIDIYKEADTNIVSLAARVRLALGEFDFEKARRGEVQDAEAEAKKRKARQRGGQGHVQGGPGGPGGPGGGQRKSLVERLFDDEGVELRLVADRSVFIDNSIQEVRNTAIMGGLLAIIVLFFFLHDLRTTAIIAISIPISLVVTFAPLNLMGVSLNIMSLGGLALGIGMLVDSSIVVLESIFRCREEGDDLQQAATRGTSEVRGAVVASTLTTIAVFVPMVFVEGVAGQAFGDLGLAVVISLLASLVVALFLIPMLASRGGVKGEADPGAGLDLRTFASWIAFRRDMRALRKWQWLFAVPYLLLRLAVGMLLEAVGKLLTVFIFGLVWLWRRFLGPANHFLFRILTRYPLLWADWLMQSAGRIYPRLVGWALRHPVVILAVVAGCLGLTAWSGTRLDTELLPEIHQGEFTVEVALPVGTPLDETEGIVSPVERAILEEKENIRSLILTVGYDAATAARSDEGENTARFKVLLDRADPATEEVVIRRLRQRFAEIPDLDARIVRPVLFSFRTPIEIEVHGDDLPLLRRQAEFVKSTLSDLPELADVETSLRPGAPEVEIIYNRDLLARYELNIAQVAQLVRDKVKGAEATRFNLKDRRIPIIVRLEMLDRETVENVRGLLVNPGGERPIPLSSVASVRLAEGPSEIRRVDGRRVALVTANIASGSLGGAVGRVDEILSREVEWPRGMTFFITGQNQEWERSQGSLWLALALSIFLVYVIMGAQFESLIHPLVIIVTIPLAFFGSVLTLGLLGISLSIVVFLGMIMLAGIVVNNAIVLVDYINTLRGRGMDRDEAIVAAGSVRLRPILMTTATTVLGLTPMALGLGDGAELRTPMAITVISGLVASTALTLVVIPVLYSVVDRLKQRALGRQAASQPGTAEAVLN